MLARHCSNARLHMPSDSSRSGLFQHPGIVHCTISSLQDLYIMTLVHCIVIMLHLNSFSSEVPCPYLSAIHNGSCSLTLVIRFEKKTLCLNKNVWMSKTISVLKKLLCMYNCSTVSDGFLSCTKAVSK